MDLLLTAGMPWPTILYVILIDEVMIVTGLVGALVKSSYKWVRSPELEDSSRSSAVHWACCEMTRKVEIADCTLFRLGVLRVWMRSAVLHRLDTRVGCP